MSDAIPGRKVRRATLPEIIRCNDLLREHIEIVGPGFCRYKNDHTDKTIAELVASDFSVSSVANIREQGFGEILKESTIIENGVVDVRISALTAECALLRRAIDNIAQRLNFRRTTVNPDAKPWDFYAENPFAEDDDA